MLSSVMFLCCPALSRSLGGGGTVNTIIRKRCKVGAQRGADGSGCSGTSSTFPAQRDALLQRLCVVGQRLRYSRTRALPLNTNTAQAGPQTPTHSHTKFQCDKTLKANSTSLSDAHRVGNSCFSSSSDLHFLLCFRPNHILFETRLFSV